MARKARAEVEGGLYHVITRGNNRRQIFNSPGDYEKFLSLLAVQKAKLSFFLSAYCLMTNHVHLLLERQATAVGRIMHRLLTGYAQYYSEEFIDATIHHIGETGRANRGAKKETFPVGEVEPERLVAAVERMCCISRADFCGSSKSAPAIGTDAV